MKLNIKVKITIFVIMQLPHERWWHIVAAELLKETCKAKGFCFLEHKCPVTLTWMLNPLNQINVYKNPYKTHIWLKIPYRMFYVIISNAISYI